MAPPDAGKLTPEMLQMFTDAQQNIMELNKSRLAALNELRSARQRIQELGMALLLFVVLPLFNQALKRPFWAAKRSCASESCMRRF